MSDGIIVALIAATVTSVPALVGALWRWSKAVEDRAYERARNESLLREAEGTIAAKDRELDAKDGLLAERAATIASQQETIDWLTAQGAS